MSARVINRTLGAGDGLRLPPHSIEAEQSVLGGLMLDAAAWDQIADRVTAEDFYRNDHRLIFEAVAVLIERSQPCDAVTLSGHLESLGLLDQVGERAPGTVVISAIGGTAGVGKTALAVNWAHQVTERFPDGQLYVNLRGYDPDQPMTAADALARFLRALGVPGPTSRRRKTSARPGTGACWPGSGYWSCWTTPGRRSRSGRCCPAPRPAWRS